MVNSCFAFLAFCLETGLPVAITVFLLCSAGLGKTGESEKEVVLRGHVLCVDETKSVVPCDRADHLFALQVADGERFVFVPEDPNTRIFEDMRLHDRELQVRAWKRGEDRLEIIKVYSIKDGRLFDIHYFCPTCNIKAFVGGLCWCCREDFEFREVPVN